MMRSFFSHTASYLQEERFMHDEAAENIKMTELIYLIISQRDGCLKSKVLSNVDAAHDNFEQIIYSHIFSDVSIEKLAEKSNRSLTSFKKEFKRIFKTSPHHWIIGQRLARAKIMLSSTSRTVSEIGAECGFANISHFIKLFKQRYDCTPAAYRRTYTHQDSTMRSAVG